LCHTFIRYIFYLKEQIIVEYPKRKEYLTVFNNFKQ
jgi:hypothetical protein